MDSQSISDVEILARQVVQDLVGPDSTVDVRVEMHDDSTDEPAYYFNFGIRHGDSFNFQSSVFRTRLAQELRERLIANGDDRYPYINQLGLFRKQ